MSQPVANILILGSTGSIGCNGLDVIRAAGQRLRAIGLSAHQNTEQLIEQADECRPRWIVITDAEAAAGVSAADLPAETQLLVGPAALEELAAHPDVDTVLSAIVGSAGLRSTWAAIEAGKRVALANKETLVVAGPLVMALAHKTGAKILPVDSEHNAVFQCLAAGRRQDLRRVILTASGGPFRQHSAAQLQQVTVEQALAHPTWKMGPKITVDSATMMNKALEIIEARWLFDLDPEIIDVVIHPQSIVHSMVEFRDGSTLAQLSPPDMRLPIQYALTYPERTEGPQSRLNLNQPMQLDFEPADPGRFPALLLGDEVARAGGTAGAVVNAANEAAVAQFLQGQLAFTEIVPACRSVLEHHDFDPNPNLAELQRLDGWARDEVTRRVCT